MGITKRFLDNGWKLENMNFWYNDDLIYQNQFSKVKHPYPFMIVQPQFETEQILEDFLNDKGIEIERNVELLNISTSDNVTSLDLKNLNNQTRFRHVTNGVVIGADGSNSKVRQGLGIEMDGWEHPAEYTLYDIELSTPISHTEGHYRFFRDGAMLMLHIRDGVWRVAGNLKDILDYLPKETKIGKVRWETNFRISEKVARTYGYGNVHILGDAAHIHSPLGAKGMNMCIEDSYLFAELFHQNKEREFSNIRREKVKNTVGVLGQLTEVVGGTHFLGSTIRRSMKPFSFLFPAIMPYVRNFLLGL